MSRLMARAWSRSQAHTHRTPDQRRDVPHIAAPRSSYQVCGQVALLPVSVCTVSKVKSLSAGFFVCQRDGGKVLSDEPIFAAMHGMIQRLCLRGLRAGWVPRHDYPARFHQVSSQVSCRPQPGWRLSSVCVQVADVPSIF